MTLQLAFDYDGDQLTITSVGGVIGPRPKQADLRVALRAPQVAQPGDPMALSLAFTVAPDSAALGALSERLRRVADEMARVQAGGAVSSEPLSFALAVGDLVYPPAAGEGEAASAA